MRTSRLKAVLSVVVVVVGGLLAGCSSDGGTADSENAPGGSRNLVAGAADQLVQTTHQVCPYSNATRGNIDVTLKAAV